MVQARQGGSVELGCNLAPTSNEVSTQKLFPMHVVEWVRLGFNIPILIQFGAYAPRVHPDYRGKTCAGGPGGPWKARMDVLIDAGLWGMGSRASGMGLRGTLCWGTGSVCPVGARAAFY